MTECPVCSLPAEEKQRFVVMHGPDAGERVVVVCVQRHWVCLLASEIREEES